MRTSTPIRPSPSTCGYLSIIGFVQGLKGAGTNPTQSSLITSLSHITDWNAAGLWVDINRSTGASVRRVTSSVSG